MSNRLLQQALSRRGLLQNAAFMALLAPVIRRSNAWGAPVAAQRRLILLYSPNGPTRVVGPATGTETNFALHPWWSSLERHKADGIFMSHMAQTGGGTVTGDGLGLGGQVFGGFGAGSGGDQYAPKGQSIDQIIGKRLETAGQSGLVRSVVWGSSKSSATRGVADGFASTAGRSIAPEVSPAQAWAQLFAKFVAPGANPDDVRKADALLARNKSVLDFVGKDCASLQSALGIEGARLLDDHCTTVRSMERSLVKTLAASCMKPVQPAADDGTNPDRYPAQVAAFWGLTSAVLACELTRVVGFQLGATHARNRIATSYGVPSAPRNDSVGDQGPDHHGWTHQGTSPNTLKALEIFTTYYATQVSLLVDKLKVTKDASGASLFDSTVIVWFPEHGGHPAMDDPHSPAAYPVVILGKGQGMFKTGRYIHGSAPDKGAGTGYVEAGRDMGRVLVTMLHYMGLTDIDTVGATGCKGTLPSLLA